MATLTSRDGTTIAYERGGSGPAAVLVDGALQAARSGSKPQLIDLLRSTFTVVAYDRRGRGGSGDTPPYAVEREIEDIEALIDAAGGQAFLYGHSSGGCLALAAARALGPKVRRVAVYEVPYNNDPAAQRAWGEHIRRLTAALAEGRRGDALALFMGYVGTPAEQVAAMRAAPFWPHLEALAPTLAYDNAGLMGATGAVPADRLAEVAVPTLVMCGGAGAPFMHDTARAIHQAVPASEMRVIAGQSHNVQPAALAPVLAEFFMAGADTPAAM